MNDFVKGGILILLLVCTYLLALFLHKHIIVNLFSYECSENLLGFTSLLLSNSEVRDYLYSKKFITEKTTRGLQALLKLKEQGMEFMWLSWSEKSSIRSLNKKFTKLNATTYHKRLIAVFGALVEENKSHSGNPFDALVVQYLNYLCCTRTSKARQSISVAAWHEIHLQPEDVDEFGSVDLKLIPHVSAQNCGQCNNYFHNEDKTSSLHKINKRLIMKIEVPQDIKVARVNFKNTYFLAYKMGGNIVPERYEIVSFLCVRNTAKGGVSSFCVLNVGQQATFKVAKEPTTFYILMNQISEQPSYRNEYSFG
ncbi:hypothetical protein ENBRE01_2036 [Enteropsectra breve]|nr:hypothetical protein ENBRE01_2036 [Enteropsectra breve]